MFKNGKKESDTKQINLKLKKQIYSTHFFILNSKTPTQLHTGPSAAPHSPLSSGLFTVTTALIVGLFIFYIVDICLINNNDDNIKHT